MQKALNHYLMAVCDAHSFPTSFLPFPRASYRAACTASTLKTLPSLGNAECDFKAVTQSRAVWWHLQSIEETNFSESCPPWTLLWAHKTGLGSGAGKAVSWLGEDAWFPTAPADELQVSGVLLARKPSWTEAHAGLHNKLHRLHKQTHFFPPVKTKVNTEQNHSDLSISLLLYILKHRQLKEELNSNCIPHFLTLPWVQGMGLTVNSLAGLIISAHSLRSTLFYSQGAVTWRHK